MTLPEGVIKSEQVSTPTQSRADGSGALEVSRTIFSVDAVLRTAYKLTDRCYVFIQTHVTRSDQWLVTLRPKGQDVNVDQLVGDFANELVDQQLRQRLEQQFREVRTLIVAQAFSEGNLLDHTRDDADYREDPLGIGSLRP